MKHFEEILSSLGAARTTALLENQYWTLWQAEYQTPVSIVKGNYLYLKSRCPLLEATPANLSNIRAKCGDDYQVIVTPKSDLAKDLSNTISKFKAKSGNTTQGLLEEYLLSGIKYRPLQREEHFVPPSLDGSDVAKVQDGLAFLTQWLVGNTPTVKSTPIGILCADGGIGKTTLARELCEAVRARYPKVFPLLIESDQWKNIANTGFTLDTLWDIAIARRLEHGNSLRSNPAALRVLMQEGLLVVIFDGFDELAAMSADKNRPQEIIAELRELFTPEDEEVSARVILTSRSTYWTAISQTSQNVGDVEVFKLSGFDNEQRKEYFKKRLSDPEHRNLAARIAKQISGELYPDATHGGIDVSEDQNADRVSGTPFILSLIAHLLEGDDQATMLQPYEADPLEPLLLGICRRENIRQDLTIPPETQLSIFEEVFRSYDDQISVEDLDWILQVFDVTDIGQRKRFSNHFLLTRSVQNQDVVSARYEVLKVYFVARFLAKGLQKLEKDGAEQAIAKTLAKNSLGQSQVSEWLASQLRQLPEGLLRVAIHHAYEIIADPVNALSRHHAAIALSHLISLLLPKADKLERTAAMFKLMTTTSTNIPTVVRSTTFAGKLRSFDFSGIDFKNCTFVDANFSSCKFSSETQFNTCTFEGTLEFTSCEGTSLVQIDAPILSADAELALSTILSRPTSVAVREGFAEEALIRALRKFKGDTGFHGIQVRRRQSGFNPRNPYNQDVWIALRKHRFIEEHTISGVSEGGCHIRDDKDVRREIVQYLDNGIVGPNLRLVLKDLTN